MEYLTKPKFLGLVVVYLVTLAIAWRNGGDSLITWCVISGAFIAYKLIFSSQESRQKFKDWLDK